MYKIAKWYNNYQSPSVLMIDDLSDVYIGVHENDYQNDWGYLCNEEHSVYQFLEENLLEHYPYIKISFYVPYAKHNIPNENSLYTLYKYGVGERQEFTDFLKFLVNEGHEIAHHGSNHGEYIDPRNLSSGSENFKHEWERFESVEEGVAVTQKGVEIFKEVADIDIVGGKYCGYQRNRLGSQIINACNFEYWCKDINFITGAYQCTLFGSNEVIAFPANFSGNAFVRLTYKTGNQKRDRQKSFFKYLQPVYNLLQYRNLNKIYSQGEIISIQEHISPATTSGNIQSANIVSDIASLHRIYNYLADKSIWYATARDIARYFYTRNNCTLSMENDQLKICFNNYKGISPTTLSIVSQKPFTLCNDQESYHSFKNNGLEVINVHIEHGENIFNIQEGK